VMIPSKPTTHMTQLDGLRALAVLGVFVEHTLPNQIVTVLDSGQAGVRLFFVLSGFLITGILIRARDQATAGGGSLNHVLRAFYARRFLRIFPLYYFVLGLALALGISAAREGAAWHLLYLSNVYFVLGGPDATIGHFWSLAVEEQFYLFWPMVVLFAPRRWLGMIFAGVAAFAPVFRFGISYCDVSNPNLGSLTPCCLDSLAMGALLAFLSVEWGWGIPTKRFCNGCMVCGTVLFLVVKPLRLSESIPENIFHPLMNACWSLLGCWAVGRAATGFRGVTGAVLSARPLV
jgi:peptidoglycan/LPS O-acetylase OafA/YrhL